MRRTAAMASELRWQSADANRYGYRHCTFSPDSARVLAAYTRVLATSDIVELDVSSGAVVREAAQRSITQSISSVAYAASGDTFYVGVGHGLRRFSDDSQLSRFSRLERFVREEPHTHSDLVAVHPDGRTLIVASMTLDEIGVVDVRSGETRDRFKLDGEGVTGLAYDRDASRLAVLTSTSSVHILDAATGAALQQLPALLHARALTACSTTPDARYALAHDDHGFVHGWDLVRGTAIALRFERAPVFAHARHRGRVLLGEGRRLEEWDLVDQRLLHTYEAPKGPITACRYDADDTRVIADCGRDLAVIWDCDSHAIVAVERSRGPNYLGPIAVSAPIDATGRYELRASRDGTIAIARTATGEILHRHRSDAPLTCVHVAGRTALVGDAFGVLSVFDLDLERLCDAPELAALVDAAHPRPAKAAAAPERERAAQLAAAQREITRERDALRAQVAGLVIDLFNADDDLSEGTLCLIPGRSGEPHQLLRRSQPNSDLESADFLLWPGTEDTLEQLMSFCRDRAERFVELAEALQQGSAQRALANGLLDALEDELGTSMLEWGLWTGL